MEVRPKSLFGRLPYFEEQQEIRHTLYDVRSGVILINPRLYLVPFPLEKLPLELRRKKIKEKFQSALKRLERIGV